MYLPFMAVDCTRKLATTFVQCTKS